MPIYHCSIKIISRAGGRSAVASAAYRSGEKLYNEETGLTHDFTKKGGVIMNEILLPENAPSEYLNREKLWNDVQKVESRSDARFAREVEVALPVEMNREQQIECVRNYIQDNFTSEGMIADWALHDKDDGNPHAHIMLTCRAFNTEHEWDTKTKSVFANDWDDNHRPVYNPDKPAYDPKDKEHTAQYRIPQLDINGEQKFRERKGKGKEMLWERVNIPSNDWNDRSNAEKWRESWAANCNRYLEPEDQIDHRSYERQGIDKIPTVHEGVTARKIEAEGSVADRCQINREINEANREIRQLAENIRHLEKDVKETKTRMQRLSEQISEMVESARKMAEETKDKAKALYEKTAHKLEGIRARFIGAAYRTDVKENKREELEHSLRNHSRYASAQRAEKQRLKSEKATARYQQEIKDITAELNGLSGMDKLLKKGTLEKELSEKKRQLKRQKDVDKQIYKACGFSTAKEVQKEYEKCLKEEERLKKVEKSIQGLQASRETDIEEFRTTAGQIPENSHKQLDKNRLSIRMRYEEKVQEDLRKEFGEHYDQRQFEKNISDADEALTYSDNSGKTSVLEKLRDNKEIVDSREKQDNDVEQENSHTSKEHGRN